MKQETSQTSEAGRGKRGITLIAVALLLLGFGLGWYVVSRVLPAQKNNEGSPLVLAGKNIVTIDDQLFGDSIVVKSIDLSGDSWLAIHEDLNGKPGNILGAAWFPQGVSSGAVELQRPTVNGGVYYAMLHADKQTRGDDGHKVFDYKIDTPLTDETGDPLMVKFMTTATPAGQ